MSVINQMLRDLDARGRGSDDARRAAMAAAGVPRHGAPRRASTSRLRWGLVVTTLLLALVVGGMLWMRTSPVGVIERAAAPAEPLDPLALLPAEPSATPAPTPLPQPAMPDAPQRALAPAFVPAASTPADDIARAAPPADVPAARPRRSSIERIAPPADIDALGGAREALAAGDADGALALLATTDGADAERDALQAAALQQLGRNADAVDAYTRALRREPDIGAWWAGLGISLESEGRASEALDAFREAQRRGPLDPALADYLGDRVEALSAGESPR